jgi:hypothetical protein
VLGKSTTFVLDQWPSISAWLFDENLAAHVTALTASWSNREQI